MNSRGKWQGMFMIARFSWPFYSVGIAILVLSLIGLLLLPASRELRVLFAVTLLVAVYFVIGSLSVSHVIYDRSELYRWSWLQQALRGTTLRHATICHCGFDEASQLLRQQFPEVHWQLLDHFNEK